MASRTQHETKTGIITHTVSTVQRHHATRELGELPLPFLDWSLVESGATNWLADTNQQIPSGEAHAFPEEHIMPAQIGVPSGVRIRVQRASKTGPIFNDECPWEARLHVGSSVIIDDDIYRLWYHSPAGLLYAQSADGIHWTRPLIDFVPFESHDSTNLLPPVENTCGRRIALHEGSIFKDPNGSPEQLYKAVFTGSVTAAELEQFGNELGLPSSQAALMRKKVLFGAASPDGLSWRMSTQPIMLHPGDMQVTVAYDASLDRYIGYFRGLDIGRRTIARAETDDFWRWPLPTTILAPGPDEEPVIDYMNGCHAPYPGNPEISLMFPTIYNASTDRTEVRLAVSYDSLTWHMVPGGPVIVPGETATFDEGSVISNAGLLYTTNHGFSLLYTGSNRPLSYPKTMLHARRFGAACWMDDRLAALEAPERGEFTTVPFRLRGSRLLLNLHTERAGEIRVEVRDSHYRPVAGRSFADGDSITGEHRWTPMTWRGDSDLSALKGHVVYFRFRLRAAKLFAIRSR